MFGTGAALIGTANDALYQQTGVIEVPTVPALLDTARVFACQPLMRRSVSPRSMSRENRATIGLT